jgi:hypothetical protein
MLASQYRKVGIYTCMVNMGSLYGGDNFMLASQYRKVSIYTCMVNMCLWS